MRTLLILILLASSGCSVSWPQHPRIVRIPVKATLLPINQLHVVGDSVELIFRLKNVSPDRIEIRGKDAEAVVEAKAVFTDVTGSMWSPKSSVSMKLELPPHLEGNASWSHRIRLPIYEGWEESMM